MNGKIETLGLNESIIKGLSDRYALSRGSPSQLLGEAQTGHQRDLEGGVIKLPQWAG